MSKKYQFDQPIEELEGVGQAYGKKLAKLEIKTIRDLIYHFPFRYLDRSKITLISDINRSGNYSVSGKAINVKVGRAKSKPKMKITEAIIKDSSGEIKAIWFNQPYLKNTLVDKKLVVSGKVNFWHQQMTMTNPDYQIEDKNKAKELVHSGRIVPVYPQTKGVSSKWLRTKIFKVIENLTIKDFLPTNIKSSNRLVDLEQALSQIHFPDDFSSLRKAKLRLSFDELLLTIIQADLSRKKLNQLQAPSINFHEKASKKLTDSLPFRLTDDQKKSAWQIIQDLDRNRPMNRLLNGDVGSGKTVVATIAALNAALSNYQTAIMVPTEILAQQHYQTIKEQLKNFKSIKVGLFTSNQKSFNIKKEQPEIIVGTHALIQENFNLKRLGLAIVDEQQRFGVRQREKFEDIGKSKVKPHFLTMTATPIPRTLSIAIYGDLNVSFIRQKPKNRKPVKTKILNKQNRKKVYEFIKSQLNKGRQGFVICPLIGGKQDLAINNDRKSVLKEYKSLKQCQFSNYRLDYLHGQMSSEEKEAKMQKMSQGKIDLLISTSIIEIGVDLPKANIILIEGAENFGLSQLHQFRGRVGRGNIQSYCFLSPDNQSEKVNRRLKVLASTNDGFKVAREDLKLRGPGELLGTRQHGNIDLKLASFFDFNLVKKARSEADRILKKSTKLKRYPQLKSELDKIKSSKHLE